MAILKEGYLVPKDIFGNTDMVIVTKNGLLIKADENILKILRISNAFQEEAKKKGITYEQLAKDVEKTRREAYKSNL